jgi:hypothetical protein
MTESVVVDNGTLTDIDVAVKSTSDNKKSQLVNVMGVTPAGVAEPIESDGSGKLKTSTYLKNPNGDDITLAAPLKISAVPSLSTVTYAQGFAIGTCMTFEDAASFTGGTGHITRVTIHDRDDLTHNGTNGAYAVHFFESAVTVTNNQAMSVQDDAEADKYVGTVYTTDGVWVDLGPSKACTIKGPSAVLAFQCADKDLFAVLQAITADSGNSSASGKKVVIQVERD